MSASRLFRVRLLRAWRIGDRLHLAGAEVHLAAAEAIHLVRDRVAVLTDWADLDLLAVATNANGRPDTAPHTR